MVQAVALALIYRGLRFVIGPDFANSPVVEIPVIEPVKLSCLSGD